MKWVVLIVALFGIVPAIASRFPKSKRLREVVLTVMAFDLFNPAHVNFYSDETYRGDSRGYEITTVDLAALAVYFGMRAMKRPTPPTRYGWVRLLYLAAVLLSLRDTPDLLRSSFSVWKVLRMYFVCSVWLKAFTDLGLAAAALNGLSLGVISQGLLALFQKYVYHAMRVQGSQSHPNSLAMIVNMVAPIAFVLILSGRATKLAVPTFALAGLCDIMSLSRGGMMMFAMSTGIASTVAAIRRPEKRTWQIVGTLFLGAAVVLARSLDTIIERFTQAPKESELARKLFNKAAQAMATDKTFGVGINMYSWVLDHSGYADRFEIVPGDRNGIAHHVYWLTAAELGFFGLGMYLLVLAAVYVSALKCARQDGVRGDIGLGVALALTTMYLQGTAEWIARQTTMSYCFWLFAALVAALRVQAPPIEGPSGAAATGARS